MALTYKVVNGVAPNVDTETTLYTCPAATVAIVTAIGWSRGVGSTGVAVITVWICDGGGATSIARQMLTYANAAYYVSVEYGALNGGSVGGGTQVLQSNSHHIPVRWHLAATDTLVAKFTVAPNATISFRPTILEIT